MLARLADALDRVGLADPAFRLFEVVQSWRRPDRACPPELDLPPAYLRVLTAGSADPWPFYGVGDDAAVQFIELAERFGPPLDAGSQVLEFGCGCGRVAARLLARRPVSLHGCDINPRLVAWCRAHLRGRFEVTRPAPPLPYADAGFDLVYALSVFTHLQDQSARDWLAELARVTRPSGLACLSFWDEHAPAAAPFVPELQAQGFHVRRRGAEGSNLFTGYFTHQGFAERAAPHWRRLFSLRSDQAAAGQAVMVLQRI